MSIRINVIRSANTSLELLLSSMMTESKCSHLGVAVAYVSTYGANYLKRLAQNLRLRQVRLVTDIRDGVTHPQALRIALDEGWPVRTVQRQSTFHPKVYVMGSGFSATGEVKGAHTYIVGSSNLSRNGLNRNVECNLVRRIEGANTTIGVTFRTLWSMGRDLDRDLLERYESEFAVRNRERSPADLSALGVSDETSGEVADLKKVRPALQKTGPAIQNTAASVAWAGLESFTGEYRFQVEFPRDAGQVLYRIIHKRQADERVRVLCEDATVREMTYRFYADNSMFRLNIPNDVPGVQTARKQHSGLAVVETIVDDNALVRLRIVHNRDQIKSIAERSAALGTWDKTQTRLYGWY